MRSSRDAVEIVFIHQIAKCRLLADCCRIDPPILAGISYHLYYKVTNYITKLPTLLSSDRSVQYNWLYLSLTKSLQARSQSQSGWSHPLEGLLG